MRTDDTAPGGASQHMQLSPPAPEVLQVMEETGRRLAEERQLTWQGLTITIIIGYDDSGRRPVEIFYHSGCPLESERAALLMDLCRVLSAVLEDGEISPKRLMRSMRRASRGKAGSPSVNTAEYPPGNGRMEPASIVGLLLREILRPPFWLPRADEGPTWNAQDADGGSPDIRGPTVARDGQAAVVDRAASAAPDVTANAPGSTTHAVDTAVEAVSRSVASTRNDTSGDRQGEP